MGFNLGFKGLRVNQSKKNVGSRWMPNYTGDSVGGGWFSGKVRELISVSNYQPTHRNSIAEIMYSLTQIDS